ncbi:MAG: AMP-binding protein [Nitrospinales bacterium]
MTNKPWLDHLTIGQVLNTISDRFPDHDALVFPAAQYRSSYNEFRTNVDATAKGLLALGINKGDCVGIWATNVPEWVILQMASARIGAVMVTINPAYRPFELKYVLAQSDVKALFLIDHFKTSDYFGIFDEVCPESAKSEPGGLNSPTFPKLRWVISLRGKTPRGMISWITMLAKGSEISDEVLNESAEKPQASDRINIQYTSGTTGFPKAAMLTHRNILLNAFYTSGNQGFTENDRVCIPVPFYHCFGCVLGVLGAMVRGAAMIVPAEYFSSTATLDAIEHEGATAIYGVPTMFVSMLEDSTFASRNLSSLRTGIMAGAPCLIEIMNRVINDMGAHQITIGYGLTEASPVFTQTRIDDPVEVRVNTVGSPIPDVEVKIIDPKSGKELGDDEQGEICVRGHVVMQGYYKDPEGTEQTIDKDGWLHSGDLALRRKDGNYRITGRIKDMVIRGGENIYPREIEEYLFTHPAVEQVSVVGVPDHKFGEELCAWIQLKSGVQATEDEIRNYCRDMLAHFKIPRYVRIVKSFPQTVSGKIQKFKIREQMIRELGLSEVKSN